MAERNIINIISDIVSAEGVDPDARAITIVTLLLSVNKTKMKDHIIEFERNQWRKIGFPDGYDELDEARDSIIQKKYEKYFI